MIHVLKPHGRSVKIELYSFEEVRHLVGQLLYAQVGQCAALRYAHVDLAKPEEQRFRREERGRFCFSRHILPHIQREV